MSRFDLELLDSQIANIVKGFYVNNREDFLIADVINKLDKSIVERSDFSKLIPDLVIKWRAHLERKKQNYVQKSRYVTWLTDNTYDLELR